MKILRTLCVCLALSAVSFMSVGCEDDCEEEEVSVATNDTDSVSSDEREPASEAAVEETPVEDDGTDGGGTAPPAPGPGSNERSLELENDSSYDGVSITASGTSLTGGTQSLDIGDIGEWTGDAGTSVTISMTGPPGFPLNNWSTTFTLSSNVRRKITDSGVQ